jgi:DNA-binding beta-propeller fold protein YncE
MAINETTNNIYIANRESNTVSIIDGTHQGSDASGCGQPWPVFNTDEEPQCLFFDPRNRTLYLGTDGQDVVWIIDATHCNNHTMDRTPKAAVPVRDSPVAIGVVFDTNTIFVVNRFTIKVTIFDGSTCNATNVTGCPSSRPPQVSIAGFPDALSNLFRPSATRIWSYSMATSVSPTTSMTASQRLQINNRRNPEFATVDPSTQTVYVANLQELTISIAKESTRPSSLGLRQTQYTRFSAFGRTSACMCRHFPLSEKGPTLNFQGFTLRQNSDWTLRDVR